MNRIKHCWLFFVSACGLSLDRNTLDAPPKRTIKLGRTESELCREHKELQCDGMVDCADGSDESAEACSNAQRKDYELNMFGLYQAPGVKYDPERYSYFFETFKPYIKESLGEAGPSTESVEVYFLEAPHSNQFLADVEGWTHAGIGFKLLGKNGTELGRVQMQYWAMSRSVPTEFLPKMVVETDVKSTTGKDGKETMTLVQNARPALDKDGRPMWNRHGALTVERSRGAWEAGYWKFPHHVQTISRETFNRHLRWIEDWQANHKMFMAFGIVDTSGATLLPMVGCTNFVQDSIKHIAGVDPMQMEGVVHMDAFFELEVVKEGANLEDVQKVLAEDPEVMYAEGKSPAHLVVVPAMYTRDGKPWVDDDFPNAFHILRPTRLGFWSSVKHVKFTTAGWNYMKRDFTVMFVIASLLFIVFFHIVRWLLEVVFPKKRTD